MKKLTTGVLVLLLIFGIIDPLYANTNSYPNDSLKLHVWKFGGAVQYGNILDHSKYIKDIHERNSKGGEFFISRQTHGENDWNAFFNFPEYGISFIFMDVGSPDYIGNAYGLLPFMNFHLFNNAGRFNMNMRIGTGVALIDKINDSKTNSLNIANSTHLCALLALQFQCPIRLDGNLTLIPGFGLTHFSNGAYKMPNKGLNIFSGSIGISYSFGEQELLKKPSFPISKKKNWKPTLFAFGGVKEILPKKGTKYFAGGTALELSRQHLDFTRFAGILDITYDASEYASLSSLQPSLNQIETIKIGLGIGYEFLFDRLSAVIQLGAYVYSKQNDLTMYQRTGLRYSFSDHFCMQLSLRYQGNVADFIEMGIGYSW